MSDSRKDEDISSFESAPPIGDRFFQQLVEFCSQGDRVESEALELKGAELNPASKNGAAKIAKFLIGAANRDPDTLSSKFAGRAIMAIGVEKDGALKGVAPCDSADIDAQVQRYLGGAPIKWDTHWTPLDESGNRGILFVIVAPPRPGDPMRWCARDGGTASSEVFDGDIYVRTKGSTRRAKGRDLETLQRRAMSNARRDFDVEVTNTCNVVSDYSDCVASLRRSLANFVEKRRAGVSAASEVLTCETRGLEAGSDKDYVAQLMAWRSEVDAKAGAIISETLGQALPGIRFSLVNRSATFLKNVECAIDFGLSDRVRLVERKSKAKRLEDYVGSKIGPFPKFELNPSWKSETKYRGYGSFRIERLPESHVEFDRETKEMRFRVEELRPRQQVSLSVENFVFMVLGNPHAPLSLEWSITAEGFDLVKHGRTHVRLIENNWCSHVDDVVSRVLK